MQMLKFKTIATIACGLACVAAAANAAEIRLRPEARATGSVVRLGEVADVFNSNIDEIQALQQIELTPAPASGKQRAITAREVQDTLERRGLNMTAHRISGASQVLVASYVETTPKPTAKKLIPNSAVQVAERAVNDAIVKCLQETTGSDEPWTIDTELTSEQAQTVLADVNHVSARGGREPFMGKQAFEITVKTDRGAFAFSLTTEVAAPSAVVVTVQPVPRGAIVQAGDVVLQRAKPGSYVDDAFRSLDAVIGREAVRGMAAGQILDPQYVRTPTLVKRGNVVTVYVKSPGVKIRTTGRARSNGGEGETITVESLLDRKSYEARVVGVDQVEIDADPVMAAKGSATEPPRLPVAVANRPIRSAASAGRVSNVRQAAAANLPSN